MASAAAQHCAKEAEHSDKPQVAFFTSLLQSYLFGSRVRNAYPGRFARGRKRTGLPATLITLPDLGSQRVGSCLQRVALVPLSGIDGITCGRRAMKVRVQRGCEGAQVQCGRRGLHE